MRHLVAAAAAIVALACAKEEPLRVEPIVGMEEGVGAAFDPADESRFLIVEKAGAIVVWTHVNGSNRRVLTIRTNAVAAIFDHGGIASIHRDGRLERWTFDGMSAGSARPDVPSRATAIVVFGDRLITADETGRIHVWNSALVPLSKQAHQGAVLGMAADAARKTLVTVGVDRQVQVWSVSADGALTSRRSIAFGGEPLAVALANDGLLAIGGRAFQQGAVELIDLARDARVLHRIDKLRDVARSLSFSALTGVLAASGDSGPVTINRDGTVRETARSDPGGVDFVVFSRRGDVLIALSPPDRWIALHSMAGELLDAPQLAAHIQLPRRPGGGRGRIRGKSYVRPFGEGFVAATEGGDVTFTDARGKAIVQHLLPDVARFVALGVSETRGFAVVATDDGKAWVCRPTGSPALLEESHVYDLAVSPSGLIAVQRLDETIAIHDPGAQSTPRRPLEVADLVSEMDFLNDDVLALLTRRTLQLRSLRDGGTTSIRLNHDFNRIAVSPDGAHLALGSVDGFIALLDRSGTSLAIWRPKDLKYASGVDDLAFSSREKLLASVHHLDGIVRLWNVPDGTPRAQPLSLPNNGAISYSELIVAAAFARTTDRLLAARIDGRGASYGLGLTSVAGAGMRGSLYNGSAVAGDGVHIATIDKGKAWTWNPDASPKELPVPDDSLHSISDVVYAPDGTLFAATGWKGPVMAWNGARKAWDLGEPGFSSELATTQSEAIYVDNGNLHWWKPGKKPVSVGGIEDGVHLTHIAATDEVALGWRAAEKKGGLAIASRQALTWKQETKSAVIAVAASCDPKAKPIFATSSDDGGIALWRRAADGRWSQAWTMATADGTTALALAIDSDGQLTAGTDGGAVEIHDLSDGKLVKSISLGNSVKRIGVARRRIWAVLGNQQIVFLSPDLELKATMSARGDEAIISTPTGWHTGKISRANFYRGTSFDALPEQQTMAMYSANNVTAALTGRFETWRRFVAIATKVYDKARSMTLGEWAAFAGTTTPIVAILVVLVFYVIAPHKLAEWAMRDQAPPITIFSQIKVQWDVIHKIGHWRRPVDRWLTLSYKTLLPDCFENLDPVKKRSKYVDLGNEADLEPWRNAIETAEKIGLWIVGPGGCGKSTLAFKLAREAMKSPLKPLPIVVVDTKWDGSLRDSLRDRLCVGKRRPTADMVKDLTTRGRILIVVDGLSERRDSGDKEKEIIKGASEGELLSVIVTSRKDPVDARTMTIVSVKPLTPDRLPDFAEAYVGKEAAPKAVLQLTDLANSKPIRPLFARLACDEIDKGRALPATYPDLVRAYVRELRSKSPTALSEKSFRLAAELVAVFIVADDLGPRKVKRRELDSILFDKQLTRDDGSEVKREACVGQLIESGLLEEQPDDVLDDGYVWFSFDVIAEYLAAMALAKYPDTPANSKLLERLRDSSNGLNEALDRVNDERRLALAALTAPSTPAISVRPPLA